MTDSNRQPTAVIKPNREQKTLPDSINSASNSSASCQKAGPLESIIFNRGAAERREQYLRDVHAFRIKNPKHFGYFTFRKWVEDSLANAQPEYLENKEGDEVEERLRKAEMARKVFFYERPFIDDKGHCFGAYPPELVPYPLPYIGVTFTNDYNSHKLLKRIYHGWPSIHRFQFANRHPKRVLDLGCGDGTWITDAAQCWPDTQFYGIDTQILWPSQTVLAKEYGDSLAKNIKFMLFNFLLDQLPFLDGAFDMVRMANLKWCIPKNKWGEVMRDVHRVTARAGLVEIIDDDFITFTDEENTKLTKKDKFIINAMERRFVKFLYRRELPLDTYEFMVEMLEKQFQTVHQDVIPIGISSDTRPIYSAKTKTGTRLSGQSSLGTPGPEGGKSLTRMMSRVQLNSSASCSSLNLSLKNGDKERPLPPKPQPVGLALPTLNRSLPCTNEEIIAHATKNMQNVMSVMIAILGIKYFENPKQKITPKWKESLWTYERTMSERLNINISKCRFDLDSDDELEENNNNSLIDPRKETIHPVSTVGRLIDDESPWAGDHSSIAEELAKKYDVDKLVRVIRVYTMWK